jgi:hypothetical protein
MNATLKVYMQDSRKQIGTRKYKESQPNLICGMEMPKYRHAAVKKPPRIHFNKIL